MKNGLMPLLMIVLIGALSKFVYLHTFSVFLFGLLCLCSGYLYGRKVGYAEGWEKRGKKDENDSIKITVT